jgi:hypothetical protein
VALIKIESTARTRRPPQPANPSEIRPAQDVEAAVRVHAGVVGGEARAAPQFGGHLRRLVVVRGGSTAKFAGHYPAWRYTYDVEAILAEMYEANAATWVRR